MLYLGTSHCSIYAYDMAQITQYALDYSGINIIIYTSDSTHISDSYNANIILQSLATRASYDPRSPSDWKNNFGSIPTIVSDALDIISSISRQPDHAVLDSTGPTGNTGPEYRQRITGPRNRNVYWINRQYWINRIYRTNRAIQDK